MSGLRSGITAAGREIAALIARRTWPHLRSVVQRGVVPAAIWRRLPVEGEFRVDIDPGASFRYLSTRWDEIGRYLCWTGLGYWERRELAVFARLARRARVFVDVGANTGVYSLVGAAVNSSLEVYAFEPLPAAFAALAANVRANGWEDRIHLVQKAASDRGGAVPLHRPHGGLPTSASLDADGFRGFSGDLIEVQAARLDDELGGLDVDLMKLDVEMFEDAVLRGMPELLSRRRPTMIVECLPDGPYREVSRQLAPHGYRFVHLAEGGEPIVLDHIDPDRPGVSPNVVCVASDEALALATS